MVVFRIWFQTSPFTTFGQLQEPGTQCRIVAKYVRIIILDPRNVYNTPNDKMAQNQSTPGRNGMVMKLLQKLQKGSESFSCLVGKPRPEHANKWNLWILVDSYMPNAYF